MTRLHEADLHVHYLATIQQQLIEYYHSYTQQESLHHIYSNSKQKLKSVTFLKIYAFYESQLVKQHHARTDTHLDKLVP